MSGKPDPNHERIAVCDPLLDGNEERYVVEAIRGGWISSSGPQVGRFERGFAEYCGRRFGVATTSGTTALHLALAAAGIGAGDEVILPDFTMAALLFAVLYVGAVPVLVDAEPDTWNLDPSLIPARLTARTRAVLAVHTYGHPCEMDAIEEITRRHGLLLIEDAAEAHGARYRDRRCGSFGALSTTSFFANKIVTTGEGGMVLTDDEALADRCRYLRNLSFPLQGGREYIHDEVGFNYRFTALQAAVGLAQLERIDELKERRRANARAYNEALQEVPGLTLPVERTGVSNVYWMYGVLVDEQRFGMSRDELAVRLASLSIETRKFFRPMHVQKPYRTLGRSDGGKFPVADRLAREGLYLPSGSGLRPDQIERISVAIRRSARPA